MGLKEAGLRGSLRNVSVGINAIPDSVASYPSDTSDATLNGSRGVVFVLSDNFDRIGMRISDMSEDFTRLRIYDYDEGDYVKSKDVSDLNAGDTTRLDYNFKSETDYGLEIDAEGSDWTFGFSSGADDYPYESDDVDIISRSDDGSQTENSAGAINDVGNTGFD